MERIGPLRCGCANVELCAVEVGLIAGSNIKEGKDDSIMTPQRTSRTRHVDGLKVSHREAGARAADRPAPARVSHVVAHVPRLIPRSRRISADRSRPPRIGSSDAQPARFPNTFERLADVIERFTERLGLSRYAAHIFDDRRRPGRLRLAMRIRNESPRTVCRWNGAPGRAQRGLVLIRKYWADPNP